jgi:hypothetical protein
MDPMQPTIATPEKTKSKEHQDTTAAKVKACFMKINPNKTDCFIFRCNAEPEKSPKCTSEFCFKSSSSAGKRHLETAHPRKYRSMFGSEEQNTNVITNYVYNKPIEYSIETFKKAVVRLFVMLNLPISAAESPHFREFCSFLRPGVAEFSADTATRVIHAEYNVYFERLKKLLAENDSKISLTTDGWSSKSLTPFSTLTGHWLDKDFKDT